jgi:hypothetical protein
LPCLNQGNSKINAFPHLNYEGAIRPLRQICSLYNFITKLIHQLIVKLTGRGNFANLVDDLNLFLVSCSPEMTNEIFHEQDWLIPMTVL